MGNRIKVIFDSDSMNESFARVVISAFMTRLNPTLEELSDVKTAVSEAVTNCIVHAYNGETGTIEMEAKIEGQTLTVSVRDRGVGIADIASAMEPLYTSKPELERSGMGFSFMETFMDTLTVESKPGEGTLVTMSKTVAAE
jgi:stage II sporulation protein AB (anti-sigma F factor)